MLQFYLRLLNQSWRNAFILSTTLTQEFLFQWIYKKWTSKKRVIFKKVIGLPFFYFLNVNWIIPIFIDVFIYLISLLYRKRITYSLLFRGNRYLPLAEKYVLLVFCQINKRMINISFFIFKLSTSIFVNGWSFLMQTHKNTWTWSQYFFCVYVIFN